MHVPCYDVLVSSTSTAQGPAASRSGGADVSDPRSDAGGGPVATLRGAQVEIDPGKVARVATAACLVALAGLIAGLIAAGVNKNAEIAALRDHGVPVEVTVTRCLGLLGGSGSNDAGYACRGSFELDGRRYTQAIPGGVYEPPGTQVRAVVSSADPGLLATAHDLAAEEPSWSVFALPLALTVVLAVLAVLVVARRRLRAGAASALRPPPS